MEVGFAIGGEEATPSSYPNRYPRMSAPRVEVEGLCSPGAATCCSASGVLAVAERSHQTKPRGSRVSSYRPYMQRWSELATATGPQRDGGAQPIVIRI